MPLLNGALVSFSVSVGNDLGLEVQLVVILNLPLRLVLLLILNLVSVLPMVLELAPIALLFHMVFI